MGVASGATPGALIHPRYPGTNRVKNQEDEKEGVFRWEGYSKKESCCKKRVLSERRGKGRCSL